MQFVGKDWEQLRGIPVDREGEYVFSLRPRTEKYPNRLLCEVKVVDNVKVVIIRSTYKIENQTLYPLELTLVDDTGHPISSLEKIYPGQDYSLPIEAVTHNKIRIQPDRKSMYRLDLFVCSSKQRVLGTNGALPFAGKISSPRKASPSDVRIPIRKKLHFASRLGYRLTLVTPFLGQDSDHLFCSDRCLPWYLGNTQKSTLSYVHQ